VLLHEKKAKAMNMVCLAIVTILQNGPLSSRQLAEHVQRSRGATNKWLTHLQQKGQILKRIVDGTPYYAVRQDDLDKLVEPIRHNRSSWNSGKCKCGICRAAMTSYLEAWRRKQGIGPAPNWTITELAVLMEDLSAEEVAERIDRTPVAIQRQRQQLGIRRRKR
jgi:predicted transcriptional regulator